MTLRDLFDAHDQADADMAADLAQTTADLAQTQAALEQARADLAAQPVPAAPVDKPALVADDFADLSGWLNGYHGTGAYAQQGVRLRGNVEVAEGVLTVHTRPVATETAVGAKVLAAGDYAAGGIMHRTVLEPGCRISMDVRMTASVGTRAVALLWPHAEPWPAGGELDFVENGADLGDRQSTAITNHWAGPDGKNAQRVANFGPHDFTDWTPVEVLWLAGKAPLFLVTIAGRVAAAFTDNVPTWPMKLAIQTAVAGGGQAAIWNGQDRTPGSISVRSLRIRTA